MKEIDTGDARLCLLDAQMPGDYSLVINRRHSYRLMRFEVYGVAIVAYQKVAALMAEMEAPLCQKPFARFSTVDQAVAWAKNLHLR